MEIWIVGSREEFVSFLVAVVLKCFLMGMLKDLGVLQKWSRTQGCPTFWHLWATLEEELSRATH